MIKFDDPEISRLLQKKKGYLNISYLTFGIMIVAAVAAAVLARDVAGTSNWGLQIAVLSVAAVFLAAFVCVTAFLVMPAGKKLNFAVCKAIADGLLAREDMFGGGGNIEFNADYEGDVLTLSRKGFTGAVTIDPARLNPAESFDSAVGKIQLDLKLLKSVPSLYGAAGTKLWLFLQGYYALHGKENGAESVTVCDNTGKKPLSLQAFSGSAPAKNATKNYFIKKGLIK